MTDGQRAELARDFARRAGRPLIPPERTAHPDFSHTRFDCKVSFAGFQFPNPTDFRSATFFSEADFSLVRFNNNADFSSVTFSGEPNFYRARFYCSAEFTSATFSGTANLCEALFNKGVDFQSARFSGSVDFQSATLADPNFGSVTFPDYANFKSANFSGLAHFFSAEFSGVADFDAAKFSGVADFGSATFYKTANFLSATFSAMASFRAATFFRRIRFINADFGGNTIFADVRFESRVLDFRGATMHEATEWHGVTWAPPGSKAGAQQQVYAYERLKQEMERLKKDEDEQNFFRRELRARRGLVRPLSGGWLLNLVYQASSDYGNSISGPLLWLFGVFAAGASIFARASLHCGKAMSIKLAAKLSFANIFVFLPDKREIMMADKTMVDCLSNTTQAVSAAQSLLGVVLLFLLGLALRNRFRMK